MHDKQDIVAIDGPSGVGKSTVSRRVAAALNYVYLDTGAMYRSVGFYLQREKVPFDNGSQVAEALTTAQLSLLPAVEDEDVRVELNGEDISVIIRTPEVSMLASQVSTIPEVRHFLTKMQREYGKEGRIVAEGRDMGTVVFPNAAWKFYLDASSGVRARRRFEQLVAQGKIEKEEAEFTKLFAQLNQRDRQDSGRSLAPLKKADDAVIIDSSTLDINEVAALILQHIKSKRNS